MVDPQVLGLIERVINSPAKLHILLVFYEHPRLEASPASLAERTCRDIWSVTEALQELAEDGVMQLVNPVGPLYRYAPRAEYHEPIARLIRGYDDPLERDRLQRLLREFASFASLRRHTAMWDRQLVVA